VSLPGTEEEALPPRAKTAARMGGWERELTARCIAWVLISVGVALHVYIDVFLSDRPVSVFGLLGVILWPSLPYILCAVMLRVWGPAAAIGGSAVALGLDAMSVFAVFIHPTSSTAPLVLLFVPLYSLVIFTPLGIAAGRLIGRRRESLS
jgi:hypothetical protein